MTHKLRSVEEVAENWTEEYQVNTRTAIKVALRDDRAHIAAVLIEGLKKQKEVIRATYDTQMEERVHRLQEVDTAIALIRTTLDVTSEEK